ncbi:MFS general substrate transporter [Hypoxylon sp. NC1633]|nr:MFS general substrate transporter [Hypoxylon sp. NC1633]
MSQVDPVGDGEITVTERTPLIGNSDASEAPETPTSAWKPGHSSSSTVASVASDSITEPTANKPGAVVGLILLIIFVASAAGAFQQVPQTRIFEDVLCREYYNRTAGSGEPIDEVHCKVNEIQSKLAYLLAILEALNAGLSCLVALFWGIVADRIGRKPVFAVSSVGLNLNLLLIIAVGWFSDVLPTRLVWIASIGHLCGGQPVMSACIHSILSDVVPESRRSVTFMRLHVTSLVGNFISPALASAMMSSTGPWPVMALTLVLYVTATAMIALLPETVHQPLHPEESESQSTTSGARVLQGFSHLKDLLSFVRSRSLALILPIFLLSMPVLVCTFQFMLQFTSKRYGIPLAQTGYILSVYGIAHIVVVLIIIPTVSNLIVRPSLPRWLRITDENVRDLTLVRWSFVAYLAGTIILGLSPTLAVFLAGLIVMSFGSAASAILKSIAASHVDYQHRSRLFTLVALLEMASSVWATPALAALFTLGMRLGGEWIGLPYFGVSVTCFAMLVLALFIRVPTVGYDDEES